MITSVTAANESAIIAIKQSQSSVGVVFELTIHDKKTKQSLVRELSGSTLALFIETIQTLTPRG